MKSVHRVLGILSFVVILWISVTGSMIQLLDMATIISHAPESDSTMQSINEGKFGDFFDYETATLADLSAARLPDRFGYTAGLQTVMRAAGQLLPGARPNFVELRMQGGRPIGQLRFGHDVVAFDAASGRQVAAVPTGPLFPPYSLRQRFKQLHRLWFTPEQPGIYVDLVSGLLIWGMIVTGLVTYARLLHQRRRAAHNRLFWSSAGAWRSTHRGVALASSVFLVAVVASGTWLAFESVWHAYAPHSPHAEPAVLDEADVVPMARTTLAAMARGEPGVGIKALRLRIYTTIPQGVVVTAQAVTRQLVFDTRTGQKLGVDAPGYPPSGFPAGRETHEWVKHFHSGYLFGWAARAIALLAGLSLVFLSASGLLMYLRMWRARQRTGRAALVWR